MARAPVEVAVVGARPPTRPRISPPTSPSSIPYSAPSNRLPMSSRSASRADRPIGDRDQKVAIAETPARTTTPRPPTSVETRQALGRPWRRPRRVDPVCTSRRRPRKQSRLRSTGAWRHHAGSIGPRQGHPGPAGRPDRRPDRGPIAEAPADPISDPFGPPPPTGPAVDDPPVHEVPEPSPLALLGLALFAVAAHRFRHLLAR